LRNLALLVAGALVLAGCGVREQLRPGEGQNLPPAPKLANRPLTPEQLLSVPTEYRPARVDEVLTRSERRAADPFDLPPPDVAGTSGGPSELEESPTQAPADPPQ
jgi:hypothetical protein